MWKVRYGHSPRPMLVLMSLSLHLSLGFAACVSHSQGSGLTCAVTLTIPTSGMRHWIQANGSLLPTSKIALSLLSGTRSMPQPALHSPVSWGESCAQSLASFRNKSQRSTPPPIVQRPPTTAGTHQTFPGHQPWPGFSPCQWAPVPGRSAGRSRTQTSGYH